MKKHPISHTKAVYRLLTIPAVAGVDPGTRQYPYTYMVASNDISCFLTAAKYTGDIEESWVPARDSHMVASR